MTGTLFARAVLYAFAALILIVLATVLWIVLYSAAIAPGHDAAFYQSYAVNAAPTIGVIVGIPAFFVFGWLIARGRTLAHGLGAAALVAVAFFVIDMAIQFLMGGSFAPPGMMALTYISKLLAAVAGGWWATRHASSLESGGNTPT